MGFYSKHVLPAALNCACSIKPITMQREKVVPQAHGNVLEIGIGSGLNLPHYDASKVTKVTGVDPDIHLWKRSEARRAECEFPVERTGLTGESLPLDDDSFDSVVVTYSLCTIPNPVAALLEMKRVLKPGGQIFFSEHGKAPDEGVHKWQNRIDPVWKILAGGCHSGRDIPAFFNAAGLDVPDLQEMYIPGPKILSYNYWGAARQK